MDYRAHYDASMLSDEMVRYIADAQTRAVMRQVELNDQMRDAEIDDKYRPVLVGFGSATIFLIAYLAIVIILIIIGSK